MKKLGILGASGHGKVLADIAELNGWQSICFYDDAWPTVTNNGSWPVVGNTSALLESLTELDGVIVGIGNNHIRLTKQKLLIKHNAPLINLIHPAASISRYVQLGIGTVVMAGANINIDTVIGDACIINTNATVDHDCQLAKGVHVSPGAALGGGVTVGRGAWVGIGASVRQLISIHAHAVVGAGAVVVKSVPPATTVIGNPASILQEQPLVITSQ